MANIVETAVKAGTFNTLLKTAKAAKVEEILEGSGPFTVFAPTDEAFAKLPEGTLDSLLQNELKLKRLVSYHITFGDVRAEDLAQIEEAETVEGSILAIDSSDGITVNNAKVLQSDILTDNGVIHVIDTVLIPALVEAE
ncbi:fasciclin domain-containing protein [Pleurocapsales cyanobacterium LEGE 06147]|nr:fasciclin domain-containing protein [Pleurocapsales cyanobacterium LEGE 06147]